MIIHGLPQRDYHANRFGDETVPPMSKSILMKLLTRSPAHAWAAHPANPDHEPTPREDKFHLGTAVHGLFLEDDRKQTIVLPFDNYRTKAAQDAKMEVLLAGKTPLLRKEFDSCASMLEALWNGVPSMDATPPLFSDGEAEVTLTWVDQGAFCKARPDWLRTDCMTMDDLKTTRDGQAAPERVPGLFYSIGYDVQAAFYLRGLAANQIDPDFPGAEFRFLFIETAPPYALAAYTPSKRSLEIANERIDFALDLWRGCLASKEWPAYPKNVRMLEPPPWAEARMWDRQDRDEALA